MKPLTDALPKSLLKINNKPIIEHQLLNLPEEYVNRIIIILGHMGDKIINYIESLDLNYPVKYYYNDNYKKTNCAYSLLKARDDMAEGCVILNCDLLYIKNNIEQLLKSNYSNTVSVRKNDNYKTDLQDILIYNDKIIKWSLNLIDANAEVMGPLKICAEDAEKVIDYFDSLSEIEKEKMHCFSLFSKLITKIDYYPIFVDDRSWIEIDTPEDLKKGKLIWE